MLLKPVCHSSSVPRPSPKRGLCWTSNSRSISVPSHRAHHVGVEGSWPQSRRRAGSGPAPTRELRALDTVVTYLCVVGSHKGKGQMRHFRSSRSTYFLELRQREVRGIYLLRARVNRGGK